MATNSIPMLKECCCGCSLKTGSMIIGYITMIWASVLSFIAVNSLVRGNNVIITHDSNADTVVQITVLTVRILQVFFSLFLIIATHKELSTLVAPWLISALVAVVVEGVSLIIMLSHLAVGDLNPRVFSMATHVSVTVYFFFVVFSYYREIKGQNKNSSTA